MLVIILVYNLSLAISLGVKYSKELNLNPKNIAEFIPEICCGLSQSRHKHGKKDACGPYDWIVYKRGSKAKEKERKRQAAT